MQKYEFPKCRSDGLFFKPENNQLTFRRSKIWIKGKKDQLRQK